ncbi:hypothetical protein ACQVA2_21950 (plasmid) [Citrobacter sp. OP27]
MAYEWKDAITPVVTIASVWIGARLALGNDNRKKVMELETARLERLAVECDSCLRNLNLYCLRVAKLLHDLSDGYNKKITLAELSLGLKKSSKAGIAIDHESARIFQNTLEIHRPADYEEWKGLILPLIKHIDIILASPSLATDDCSEELSRMFGNPEELKSYADVLLALASSLPAYRQELFRRIANDYRALTHPAPLNIWTLSENAGNAIRKFFRRPPTF